jgi:hypothetical protein
MARFAASSFVGTIWCTAIVNDAIAPEQGTYSYCELVVLQFTEVSKCCEQLVWLENVQSCPSLKVLNHYVGKGKRILKICYMCKGLAWVDNHSPHLKDPLCYLFVEFSLSCGDWDHRWHCETWGEMQWKHMTNLKRLFCFLCHFNTSMHLSVHMLLCWLLCVVCPSSLIIHLWQAYRHATWYQRTMLLDIHAQYSDINITEVLCSVVNRKRSSLQTMWRTCPRISRYDY